jgi:uncharacterized OsmC-like protein
MTTPSERFSYDPNRIRAAHEERIAAYAADPKPLHVSAEIRAIDGQLKEAHSRGFVIRCDEGPIVGGTDQAPSPLTYLVSSIGFAVLTDLIRACALDDVPLTGVRLSIGADFPLGGKYAGDGGTSEADRFAFEVEIDSPAPRERLEAAVRWTEEHCHALSTVRRPVSVVAAYRANGAPLDVAASEDGR